MVLPSSEHVLVIGDMDRQISCALMQAMPSAKVTSVASLFDGIAELSRDRFTTVLASVEPIERRPEAAVKTLRELSRDGRLLLFGHPTLEPLSQKMMEFGCDDYLVTPVTAAELLESLSGASVKAKEAPGDLDATVDTGQTGEQIAQALNDIPLDSMAMDALVKSPQDAMGAMMRQINAALPAAMQLSMSDPTAAPPEAVDGVLIITRQPGDSGSPAPDAASFARSLHLSAPASVDRAGAASFLGRVAQSMGKLQILFERHVGLQRMAIQDDLTGLHNGRYFRQFLAKIIERARVLRFPVTLFLFDIDNFKRYNDQFGHGVGDEILKQTAALMKRCVRDHDLVSRISGDEFAVVFWEKEGPRAPREPKPIVAAGRAPNEPHIILDRFRRLLATQEFQGLGPGGKGTLTISGGLAVYPYDAQDCRSLIDAADTQLMFGAKRQGRNSIHLVGGQCLPHPTCEGEEGPS
jgi:PleD family two-component response regulator